MSSNVTAATILAVGLVLFGWFTSHKPVHTGAGSAIAVVDPLGRVRLCTAESWRMVCRDQGRGE